MSLAVPPPHALAQLPTCSAFPGGAPSALPAPLRPLERGLPLLFQQKSHTWDFWAQTGHMSFLEPMTAVTGGVTCSARPPVMCSDLKGGRPGPPDRTGQWHRCGGFPGKTQVLCKPGGHKCRCDSTYLPGEKTEACTGRAQAGQ